MLTEYQTILKAHLKIIFERNDLVTTIVIVDAGQREFITDLALEHDYIPTFSIETGGYVQFCGIKRILPC